MTPCCWLGRPRVYRRLLDMVDTKQQQRRNSTPRRQPTTKRSQHTQQLLTTPRFPSATPPRLPELRDKLRCPELHHQSARVLHHRGSKVLHHRVYCPSLLHRSPQVLHDYECCPSLLHRGSSLIQYQSSRVLRRTAQVLLCPELHQYN
jgi:hypothetical protein